jgi:hypothetical protein
VQIMSQAETPAFTAYCSQLYKTHQASHLTLEKPYAPSADDRCTPTLLADRARRL